MTSRQRMNKFSSQCSEVMGSVIQANGGRVYMNGAELDELRWLYGDISNAGLLVLVKKDDIPAALDFDAFLALLDMLDGMAMILDADGNLRQIMPGVTYI